MSTTVQQSAKTLREFIIYTLDNTYNDMGMTFYDIMKDHFMLDIRTYIRYIVNIGHYEDEEFKKVLFNMDVLRAMLIQKLSDMSKKGYENIFKMVSQHIDRKNGRYVNDYAENLRAVLQKKPNYINSTGGFNVDHIADGALIAHFFIVLIQICGDYCEDFEILQNTDNIATSDEAKSIFNFIEMRFKYYYTQSFFFMADTLKKKA